MTNEAIAKRLRDRAAELSRKGDNVYRVRAFRQAAFAVSGWPVPLGEVVRASGRAGLKAIPGVGASLAETLEQFATADETVAAGERPRLTA